MASTKTFFAFLFACMAFSVHAETITLQATVSPRRTIVVDEHGIILQIASNSSIDVKPDVVLDTIDGTSLQLTKDIYQAYSKLLPSLDVTKPGIVYSKPTVLLTLFQKLRSTREAIMRSNISFPWFGSRAVTTKLYTLS